MLSARIESAELRELAERKVRRELRFNPSDFERLPRLAILNAGQGEAAGSAELVPWLATEIGFDIGPEGFPRVQLAMTGALELECQRCLQPVSWQVALDSQLTVLSDEAQIAGLADPFDSIVMGADGLRLASIIEDEILAALPMAPVHGPGSDCAESGKAIDELEMKTHRPFADLASLLGTDKYRND